MTTAYLHDVASVEVNYKNSEGKVIATVSVDSGLFPGNNVTVPAVPSFETGVVTAEDLDQ